MTITHLRFEYELPNFDEFRAMKQTIDKPYSKVCAEHGAQAYLKDDKQMVGLPGPFYQGYSTGIPDPLVGAFTQLLRTY